MSARIYRVGRCSGSALDWLIAIASWAIAIVALVALLTGCASPGIEIPREVRVQVPVACVAPEDRPTRPALLSDGDILLLDSYRAVYALWGDRLERDAYERKLEAIVEGCSRIPAVSR